MSEEKKEIKCDTWFKTLVGINTDSKQTLLPYFLAVFICLIR
jgi:hypothetical protein